jgi:hypothetical protein
MKNKLQDLRDHLFETLERVKEAEKPEEVDREIARAKAVVGVAGQITATAKIEIEFAKVTGRIAASGFIPVAALPEGSGTPPRPQQLGAGTKAAR